MVNKKNDSNKNDLSEAARIMRTDPDPEKRSEAASKMGHAGGPIGGAHSHGSQGSKKDDNA